VNILLIHNFYQQPGGEDVVFRQERQLLEGNGHRVIEYVRSNNEIRDYGLRCRATLAARTVWAWDSYLDLRTLLSRNKADIAHFHNTFPLISPAAYYACRHAAIPVVQTLHNYRLFCPGATFYRDGHICEECAEHSLSRAVSYGCYRESRAASAGVALMLEVHRLLRTWTKEVDAYVALTEFARHRFISCGLPAEKIVTKPHFLYPDPGERYDRGQYALFTGRLSPEKGLETLLAAWKLGARGIPLVIVGDGPLRPRLELEVAKHGPSNVALRGRLTRAETLQAIKGASFLVVPSRWYEGFCMNIVEAFASGVPVLCSRLGAMQEIVSDGRTGLHFTPGDAEDMAQKVEWAWTHSEQMAQMGKEARREYEAKYTAERNYTMLMEIYQRAIGFNT
jgi:glycosyltransferase involved in cell wall biosynthesis